MAVVKHAPPARFEVWLVKLDPTSGHEIKKTRPCAIVSPDDVNQYLGTVIIAPMTTAGKLYPTRISCTFKGKRGFIVLDQIRAIDKRRLVKKLGKLERDVPAAVSRRLAELFTL